MNIMNNNPYIFHNSRYQVLLCKHHQYAIPMKSIVSHFRDKHDITKEAWQEIVNYTSRVIIKEAKELTHPIKKIAPIPYLKIIEGYSCEYQGCDIISGTLESVKHHCRGDHEWKAKEGVCWSRIRAQTFYQNKLGR